jgi:hypothetical protein
VRRDRREAMANESGLACRNGVITEAESVRPYYKTIGSEEAIFKAAYRQGGARGSDLLSR